MKVKTCFHCKAEKSVACFTASNRSHSPDKLSMVCIECAATLTPKQRTNLETAWWRRNNPTKSRSQEQNSHFQRNYGITLQEYETRLERQNGFCAICKQSSTTQHQSGQLRSLSVDHNHLTGQVRALLCNSCNHGLGAFKDNVALLKAAIEYLEKHE